MDRIRRDDQRGRSFRGRRLRLLEQQHRRKFDADLSESGEGGEVELSAARVRKGRVGDKGADEALHSLRDRQRPHHAPEFERVGHCFSTLFRSRAAAYPLPHGLVDPAQGVARNPMRENSHACFRRATGRRRPAKSSKIADRRRKSVQAGSPTVSATSSALGATFPPTCPGAPTVCVKAFVERPRAFRYSSAKVKSASTRAACPASGEIRGQRAHWL